MPISRAALKPLSLVPCSQQHLHVSPWTQAGARLEHPQKGSLSSAVVYPAFPPSLFVLAVCHAVLRYLAGIFSNISLCHLEQTFPQLWAWVPHLVSCLCSINRAENPICCSFRGERNPAALNKKNKQPKKHPKRNERGFFTEFTWLAVISSQHLLSYQHKVLIPLPAEKLSSPATGNPCWKSMENNVCSLFRETQFMSLIPTDNTAAFSWSIDSR